MTRGEFVIKPIDPNYRARANDIIKSEWAGPMIASKGKLIDTAHIPGFAALDGDDILGLITYHIANGECEIVTLNSMREGRGVGGALIRAALDAAREARCRRAWLITTNDSTLAMRYYQRNGFQMAAIHIGALDTARKLKPSIPKIGIDGIPLMHEIEFEMKL